MRIVLPAWTAAGLVVGLTALAVWEDEAAALWAASLGAGLATMAADAAWFLSGREPVARAPWGRRRSS